MSLRFGVLLAALAVAVPSSAAVIQETPLVAQARTAGLIGERFDGYLGFVTPPSEALRRQVTTINIRRRALYSNLAASRNATPQEVGIAASCTLFARIPVNGYYLTSETGWRRRAPGQAAPRPAYCG